MGVVALERAKPAPFAFELEDQGLRQRTLGVLKLEIFLVMGDFFSIKPQRFKVTALECVDAFVQLELECEALHVEATIEFFRAAAVARGLTFEARNRTGLPNEFFGI
ncbi:hypothetical protein EXS62_01110 [Candidatus Kaiserbacteria bacterium]|nr:hypothetical protein [Candidatus Kaiserbacteria bacterium]